MAGSLPRPKAQQQSHNITPEEMNERQLDFNIKFAIFQTNKHETCTLTTYKKFHFSQEGLMTF